MSVFCTLRRWVVLSLVEDGFYDWKLFHGYMLLGIGLRGYFGFSSSWTLEYSLPISLVQQWESAVLLWLSVVTETPVTQLPSHPPRESGDGTLLVLWVSLAYRLKASTQIGSWSCDISVGSRSRMVWWTPSHCPTPKLQQWQWCWVKKMGPSHAVWESDWIWKSHFWLWDLRIIFGHSP